LLRIYGVVELLIAALALVVTLALPTIGPLAARASSYVVGAGGWFELSPGSYIAGWVIALVVLTPVTLLMGATLTLLVRHLVKRYRSIQPSTRHVAISCPPSVARRVFDSRQR